MIRKAVCLFIGAAGLLAAQTWEVGAGVGYGSYRNLSVTNGTVNGKTGYQSGMVLTAVLAQRFADRWTAELRYLYEGGSPFLESGSAKLEANGLSHALHYDILFHILKPEARVQPYVSFGAGAKFFHVSGATVIPPALQPIGYFRNGWETKFLYVPGAGVKFRVNDSVQLNVGFRDYVTGLPKSLVVPAGGSSMSGYLQQMTVFGGISYTR